jgi:hypothetical protein
LCDAEGTQINKNSIKTMPQSKHKEHMPGQEEEATVCVGLALDLHNLSN